MLLLPHKVVFWVRVSLREHHAASSVVVEVPCRVDVLFVRLHSCPGFTLLFGPGQTADGFPVVCVEDGVLARLGLRDEEQGLLIANWGKQTKALDFLVEIRSFFTKTFEIK